MQDAAGHARVVCGSGCMQTHFKQPGELYPRREAGSDLHTSSWRGCGARGAGEGEGHKGACTAYKPTAKKTAGPPDCT